MLRDVQCGPVVTLGALHAPDFAASCGIENDQKACVEVIEVQQQSVVMQRQRRPLAEGEVHAHLYTKVFVPQQGCRPRRRRRARVTRRTRRHACRRSQVSSKRNFHRPGGTLHAASPRSPFAAKRSPPCRAPPQPPRSGVPVPAPAPPPARPPPSGVPLPVATAVVRNSSFPAITGVEWPRPGTASFHAMFERSAPLQGRVPWAIPVLRGPRHCGHSGCALIATVVAANHRPTAQMGCCLTPTIVQDAT